MQKGIIIATLFLKCGAFGFKEMQTNSETPAQIPKPSYCEGVC